MSIITAVGLSGRAQAQIVRGMKVLHSDASELVLEVRPQAEIVRTAGGEIYPQIASARILNLTSPGAPMRMRIYVPVALPAPSGSTLEVTSAEYGEPLQGAIAPVPRLVTGPDRMTDEVYQADPAAYARPWEAAPVASLAYRGVARDFHEGAIEIEPYRYDPATKTIRLLTSVTVRLRYGLASGGARVQVDDRARATYANASVAANWGIPRARLERQTLAKRSVVPASSFRVDVREEGMVALTAEEFKAGGIDIATLDPSRIAIYGGDGGDLPEAQSHADSNVMHRVPAIIETSGGRVSRVLFYGAGPSVWTYEGSTDTLPMHRISPYVTANSYIVAVGGDSSLGYSRKEVPGGPATVMPTSGLAHLFLEEEKVNVVDIDPSAGGSGRDWFGDEFRIDVPNMRATRVYSTPLPMLDRSQQIEYRARVAHTAKNPAGGSDGTRFTIQQNGGDIASIPIGTLSFTEDIAAAVTRRFSAPASMVPGNNVSLLTFGYSSPVVAAGYLDWFEIHYWRQLAAEGDQIIFAAPTGSEKAQYRITNFSNTSDVVVLDISDPANVRQLAIDASDGSSITFSDMLRPRRVSARYWVGRLSASRKPVGVARVPFADLRGRMLNADILVVANDDFRAAADKYVKYRNAQGRYTAAYVTTSEIYTEFSHGNLDPTAIRDYIAYAYKRWERRPSFVLLIGDGSYDYRNIATKQRVYVPTYETPGSDNYDANNSLAYDDYFVRIHGKTDSTYDQVLDLPIGRLPIETNAQAELVIDKIRAYESSTNYGLWRQTVIMAADDAYPLRSTDNFITQSEGLWRDDVPKWVEPKKIYLSLYPTVQVTARRKPAAEQDLMQFIERGAVITNWLGHGNPNVWAHEYVLQKDEFIPRLTNDSTLTFVTAATCNFGNFDDPTLVSGAEMFLLQPKGGAIALMTSTRASYIGPNQDLIRAYFDALFRRDPVTGKYLTIGEALMVAKSAAGASIGNDQKYVIFGDPALTLNFPKDSIEITRVNSTEVSTGSEIATVGALSVVTVEGVVRDVTTGGPREGFNGRAIVTLYDADRNLSVEELEFRQYIDLYGGRLFRGPAQVTNGRFSVTFRVPKDIAFDTATARLHAYAFSGGDDATGSTTRIKVYGSDTSTVTDLNGPDMKLFMDDRSFRSGDMVSSKPMLIVDLQDTSGINSSGSGLGHRIEAWIDDNPTSVDLTDLYQSDVTTYRKGSAERQLTGLEAGEHQVKVRAWDIFNNPTEGLAFFRIAEGPDAELQVAEVVNYPNPMERETDFLFRHNQTRPVDVDVAIFTLSGRKVRQLEARALTDRFVRIHWDGTDIDGDRLANGVYFYRLRVRVAGDDSGREFETIEKVAIVR